METTDPLAELDEVLGKMENVVDGKTVTIMLGNWYIVATHAAVAKNKEVVTLSVVCTDDAVKVSELVFTAQRGRSRPAMTTNSTTESASVWVFLFRKPTKTSAITIRRVVNPME